MISAAKKIAEAGSRMDKLGRTIADHVSERLALGFLWSNLDHSKVVTVMFFWGHNTLLISDIVLNLSTSLINTSRD